MNTSTDDWAYETIHRELENGDRDIALWTRAFAQSGGDEQKTKAIYIQLRAGRLLSGSLASSSEHSNQGDLSRALRAAPAPAGPWHRFFARTFDLWLEIIPAIVVFVFIVAYVTNHIGTGAGGTVVFAFLVGTLPAALLLDASIYSVFGNTPGKAWLGISVRTPDGKRLTFGRYLKRNLNLWFRGLGFSLPLVTLITMAIQKNRLAKGKPASYDAKDGYLVEAASISPIRQWGFYFTLICFTGVYGAVSAAMDSMLDTATQISVPDKETLPPRSVVTAAPKQFDQIDSSTPPVYSKRDVAIYLLKQSGMDSKYEAIRERGYSDDEIIAKQLEDLKILPAKTHNYRSLGFHFDDHGKLLFRALSGSEDMPRSNEQTVQLPDGTALAFQNGMSPDAMTEIIRSSFPEFSKCSSKEPCN